MKHRIHGLCASVIFFAALAVPAGAGPFTPKSYITTVLDASPTMRKAEQSFKQAENTYKSALLDAALPSFTFSMSDTFYDEQERRLRFEKGEVASSLSASWNLYDSASSPLRRIKTARLAYQAARLDFLIAKQNEAVKALDRFYALYSAQRRIGIAKMNLSSRERQYKDTNEQFQSGTRSHIEVTQSEGDKLDSELSLARAETAEIKALMAFNELINSEPDAPQAVEISTLSANVKLPLPREDVAKALENNFSLRQQKLSLEKTRLTNRAAVLSNYPRFKVDAAWRKTELGLLGTPGGSGPGNPSYSLGASLSLPFGFLGAQNYLEVKTLEAALKSAELEIENSVRALRTSVLSAQKDIAGESQPAAGVPGEGAEGDHRQPPGRIFPGRRFFPSDGQLADQAAGFQQRPDHGRERPGPGAGQLQGPARGEDLGVNL